MAVQDPKRAAVELERALLDTAPLSSADREKIAHGNADRVLRLERR